MLVKHVFPSDGEYTVTITPIFGDNMTPTGFGSVPCERLEVSLDGERLQLLDWKGGGRQDAAVCRGAEDGCGEQRAVGLRISAAQDAGHVSRRRPDCTRSAPRSSRPTSRRCSTSTSSSCGRRCRRVRRRATRSSRTSDGPHRRARSTPCPRRTRRAAKPSSSAGRLARLRSGLRAQNHHQPGDAPPSGVRRRRPTSIR